MAKKPTAAENPRERIGGNNPPSLAEILAEKPENIALAEKLEDLAMRANTAPKAVKSDEDLAVVAKLIVDVRAFRDEERSRFEVEKAPIREQAAAVDTFFNAFKARYEKITTAMKSRADAWQDEKDRIAREEARKKAAAAEAEAKRQAEIAERNKGKKRGVTAEVRQEAALGAASEAGAAANAPVADLTRTNLGGVTASGTREWYGTITDYNAIDLNALRDSFMPAEIEKAIARHAKKHEDRRPVAGVAFASRVKGVYR